MFLLYFLLWVIFNGAITLEIAAFGIVIAAVLFAFTCKYMDYSIAKEIRYLKMTFSILHYIRILVKEIIKANAAVIHMIMQGEEVPEPAIVTFQSDLKKPMSKVMLANSITLTPGTITVSLEDNEYTVHCLDGSLAEGMDQSVFVDMLKDMEKM